MSEGAPKVQGWKVVMSAEAAQLRGIELIGPGIIGQKQNAVSAADPEALDLVQSKRQTVQI